MRRKLFLSILLTLVLASLAGTGLAQDGNPPRPSDDAVNAIAKQLYCPVCENIPLDVCPTQACAEWRELIRDLLAEGYTEPEIKEYFVNQYGDRVLAVPPPRGFNWLAYIVPPVVILVGIFILFRAFQAWKKPLPAVAPPSSTQAHEDEYVQRLEEELRKL